MPEDYPADDVQPAKEEWEAMEREKTEGFIVELEPGVWIAETGDDPPRTIVKENATVYFERRIAKAALQDARQYRPTGVIL